MILDAFGPDALPLLVSGSLGGLVRGLLVLRSAIAKSPVSSSLLIATGLDTGTSVIIGAIFSLFLHGWAGALLGPLLAQLNTDKDVSVLTSGFIVGFGCIALGGLLWDFLSGIKKKPDAAIPPSPPAINPQGTP